MLAAGLAHLGLFRTTTFQAAPHITSGALVPLLLDWCADMIPIHVVYPPNRHVSTKLRVFVDWAAELFARSDLISRKCCMPQPAGIDGAAYPQPAVQGDAAPAASIVA